MRHGQLLLRLTVIAIAASALTLMTLPERPTVGNQTDKTEDSALLGADLESRCIDGKTTVAGAQATLPFPLLMPDSERASDENLTGIFLCPDLRSVSMFFESGIRISLLENGLTDPAVAFSEAAEMVQAHGEPPGLTTVGTIEGAPALLFDPEKDPTGEVLGGLRLVREDIEVNIVGDGRIPLEDMAETAASLRPVE